eukprot:TRINITY_DN1881_c0_g1_i5.p1 TRINITY_DN1881_c0_g1~~TRINITY_DN1881_c0_g1_i5.p1  ORF type:complete len:601 (+),score=125.94 TRINITY_DN1881_c0_g1_i5:189-1991(+)
MGCTTGTEAEVKEKEEPAKAEAPPHNCCTNIHCPNGLTAENSAQAEAMMMLHGEAGIKSVKYVQAKKSTTDHWDYCVGGQRVVTDPDILSTIMSIGETPFCDPDFDPATMPHTEDAVDLMSQQPDACCWLRPSEFIGSPPTDPEELLYGATRSPNYCEVAQGMCGDCWFISSVCTLAATLPELIKNRILEANPEKGYYVVCFWKDDAWREVIVDDRLLILGGKDRGYDSARLMYGSTANREDPSEPAPDIWMPIIEKAYAKLHGGYPFLEGGHLSYGACDLTGGCPLIVEKKQAHKTVQGMNNMFEWEADMFYFIREEANRRGILQLIGCSVHAISDESENEVGLLTDHEYSVIRLIRVEGYPLLVVLRNPWGKEGEFTGDWSDSSDRWTPEMCKLAEYSPEGTEDGMFVMTFKDMQKYFDSWELNHLYSDSTFRSITRSAWEGSNAAGCGNVGGDEAFLNNPQFLVEIPEPPNEGMRCNAQFSAEQEDVIWTKNPRQSFYPIQLVLYAVSDDGRETSTGRLIQLDSVEERETTGNHKALRTVSMVVPGLAPGKYILIASTFEPNCTSSLEITAWATYPVKVCELGRDGAKEQQVLTGGE